MTREIIRPLAADSDKGGTVTLLPGTLIHDCRIFSTRDEPYVVEFEASGGRYRCALVYFQPRTRCVTANAAEPAALAIRRTFAG